MTERAPVIFNINFLNKSAINLAKEHASLSPSNRVKPIKPILEESRKVLNNAYRVLAKIAKSEQEISPAAEWLIDNFYIIQEQIVQAGIDFPKEYQQHIPSLPVGEHKGLPRVYELTLDFLSHTDNVFDSDVLVQYIQNYQGEETLLLGEIWAIPIMMRLILIQNLAEKASRILYRKKVRQEASQFINDIEEENPQEPGTFSHLISDWANIHSNDADPIHLVELFNQMQSTGLLLEEQKRWFSYRIRQYDMTLEDAMRMEAQKQSRLQVSLQNAVISLREITETDWAEFVEECSIIEHVLKLDPAGRYSDMDFETRDSYRRSVERLSRKSNLSETEVAEQALLLAEEQARKSSAGDEDMLNDRSIVKTHIGYFLIGDGYQELKSKTGYSVPFREWVRNKLEKYSSLYLLGILFLTIVLLGILWLATGTISESPPIIITVLLIAFFPLLDLSISTVNRFLVFILPPRVLPKMDYKEGIPDESRTFVVVPTMFSSPSDAIRQIENMEIHSLANPDPALQFAILSDFCDADKKEVEGDEAILKTALNAIKKLNSRYTSQYGDRFFLLHRERLWNKSEDAWMGWERKRGKIEEFNTLLCDDSAITTYKYIEGDFLQTIRLQPIPFVITLDSDTKLPPESAKNLIRTIAHPLNRAWYDPAKKRITKGYSVIQPRISHPPESSRKTRFSKIFSGNVGLDPYSTAVSDIYQDLTGEAIFIGKGIYDVKAFHNVLDKRFPDNRILSHDLIESSYLRAGLATEIELFDDYPSTYASFSKRNHRWTRGDWQIASWIFPKVPERSGKARNPINKLSKWKIFDNLRRSLNPFFLTLFFVAGIFWLPGSGWIWAATAFSIMSFPIYISLSSDILNRPARVRWKLYMNKVRANLKINSIQAISTVIILPHQAVIQLDAIFRTMYRMFYSKKLLLEWTMASRVEGTSPNSLSAYLRMMMLPVILGIGIFIVAVTTAPYYLWIVFPFALLWAGSPVYVWFISQPVKDRAIPISEEDKLKLRSYARRTWFYFERFVNEKYSWLPPDNYQEDPPLPVAERTSPTNIGLALVSNQVAYNMGYITIGELLERQLNSITLLDELEKYKGHCYNWYETRKGEALNPRYISTVDSGNLAAGLIVVKEAINEVMNTRGINRNFKNGLQDSLISVQDIFSAYSKNGALKKAIYNKISQYTSSMINQLKNMDTRNKSINMDLLISLKEDAVNLNAIDILSMKDVLDEQEVDDLIFWLESPLRQLNRAISEYKCILESNELDLHNYSPDELRTLIKEDHSNPACNQLIEKWFYQAVEIVSISEKLINEMDFSFLYLKKRGLFTIGYNTENAQFDKSTYDLLASEARIASYIAISKGEVPVEHWFRLSRRLTNINQDEILLSWGGTIFEYLMPLLFMRSFPNTLMNHTYQNVIRWQRNYGNKRKHPWGFSESAYYFLNIDMHYQYRTFGAPGLGLRRGLADEYVVAPYASMLSLMVDQKASLDNLKELEKLGGLGLFGFYDAIDFTTSHFSDDVPYKLVKTYMVHHHGMSLIALEDILNDWSINNYFHSDLRVKGCELILQEKIPRGVPIKEPHPIDVELEPGEKAAIQNIVEHSGINDLDKSPPRLHTLTNGSYSTMISHAGTGHSSSHGIMMNAWKPDPTIDPLGFFIYIKDIDSGIFWSSMHQPVKRKPDRYDTWYHNGKIITTRVDEWIETTTEICVSPDHPIELRKLTLTNYSDRIRNLEITSYAEIVLNKPESHYAHPAFSKLFIQTDYLAEHHAIIAKRRPRSDNEKPAWLIHTFADRDTENLAESLQYETERMNFISKGRSLSNPAAMADGFRLKGSLGNVSDPIVSLRKKITIGPGEKIQLTFGLGYADSREEAIQLADLYDNQHVANRAFDLALIYSYVVLDHIGITARQAHYFQKLASYIYYSDPRYRTSEDYLRLNTKKQHELWAYGISGDYPLVIFRISDTDQLKQVKTLLKAQSFWKMRGIESELLFLNDHAPGYVDEVQESIQNAIESSLERDSFSKRGGVFIQRTDKMNEEDLTLLLSVAHAIFDKKLPNLADINLIPDTLSWYFGGEENYRPAKVTVENLDEIYKKNKENLLFFNEYGGFSKDGDEYHILIKTDPNTGNPIYPPAPWINIISNPEFGFTVSERGAGYTWSENSRENKITSWSNDPVTDVHSEAIYIRDEEKKIFWSPTPGPVPGSGFYKVIHGFGYTRFEHFSNELEQELIQFVPENGSVKISKLTLKNKGTENLKLSVFRYLDLVLGVQKESSARFTITDISKDEKTIYARNNYNNAFAGRTVFSTVNNSKEESQIRFTTDRSTFIGRNRSLNAPFSLCYNNHLDNRINNGGDICAAFQTVFELAPEESIILTYLDGECRLRNEADGIINSYSDHTVADTHLLMVKESWRKKLSRIQVETPDKSLDIMVNGWLMYQNISSRMWARTGFYQAGGAFGFRDQLQDAAAAIYVDPEITRNQILLHAEKQFKEGDVLHWWHAQEGRGIRSKITDDRLWLPYVVEFYIASTGDDAILEEEVSYISARKLEDYEHELYLHPETLNEKGTIYEHCCKAIDISLQFGVHGLPLIGGGDWNDGMNRVGENGKGESVWLGFFIYYILIRFEIVCRKRNDLSRADNYNKIAEDLKVNLNNEGWDKEWYLRAFYDDGTPLGSAENDECRIDAISQAWSVISEAASNERGNMALQSVENHLISENDKIIRLLAPPFDITPKNPGYIKGYIPGVRENGGQYTHGATWTIKAFAESGMGNKAVYYFNMINPVNHATDKETADLYKVEPYVVAADVYGEMPLIGQGGWTWYTGSAGWMYRVAIESILGLTLQSDSIILNPSIAENWPSYSVKLTLDDDQTVYNFKIENPEGLESGILEGTIDGEKISQSSEFVRIPINKDIKVHEVILILRESKI